MCEAYEEQNVIGIKMKHYKLVSFMDLTERFCIYGAK